MLYKEIPVIAEKVYLPGKLPDFSEVITATKAAIASGYTPFIRPNSFFPANFTLTNQPAYATFEKGCSSLRDGGLLRIHVVAGTNVPIATAPPEPGTDRARVANFNFPWGNGEILSVPAPGALWRSPAHMYAGIPGGQLTKYGVLKDSSGRGTKERPRINLDGSFTYTLDRDAPIGAVEEVVFLLLDKEKADKPSGTGQEFVQPYKDPNPYFDPETHYEYCGIGQVPALNKSKLLGYGAELGKVLAEFKDKIAFWSAPINEPEYRVFWPRRWQEADNAPDLDALWEEVVYEFNRGLRHSLTGYTQAGPDTGSPDVLEWWLNLPRTGSEVVTFHAYNWAGETFPDGIVFKLDNWLKPQLDAAGWSGQVVLTELGDVSTGKAAIGQVDFDADKWTTIVGLLKTRPWITAAFNPLTGLVETL